MTSEFQQYLERNTRAVIENGRVLDFGNAVDEVNTARSGAGKCPLLSSGVVRLRGDDVQKFINAQFTTNCLEINPQRGQFSGWCDPKGRVLFLFVLYTDGESFYALIPRRQIEKFITRLRMFVLRADVVIEDASDEYVSFGLVGESLACTTGLDNPWDTTTLEDGHVLRCGPGQARFVAVIDAAAAAEYWRALTLPSAGEACWTALDAYAGLPRIDEDTSGEYLPQHLNLDVLNALSFSKGCYPGQEIIARLKYRGEVKKRLMVGLCASQTLIAPHAPIHAAGTEARTVGRVLYAQQVALGQTLVAAVIELNADLKRIELGDTEAVSFDRIDLPYAIG